MFSRVEKVQTIHVQQGETERKYNVMYEKGDKQFTYHLFMPLLYYLIFISSCLFIIIYNGRKNNDWSKYLLQFLTLFSLTYISSIAYGRMDVLGMIVMSSSFNYSLVLFLLFLMRILTIGIRGLSMLKPLIFCKNCNYSINLNECTAIFIID